MPGLAQRMWSSDPAATMQQRPEGHAQLTDTGRQDPAGGYCCQNVQPARFVLWLLLLFELDSALAANSGLWRCFGNLDFVLEVI